MNEARLTHLDESGRARMVDVSNKPETRRVAVAAGEIRLRAETLALVQRQGIVKGDVLGIARVAGVMAAKQTAHLIPLCHPLPIDDVAVAVALRDDRALIEASVVTVARTGAEMEALVAVSAAAMTIYDMCKAVDREMVIENVRLVSKTGGKSDFHEPGYAPILPALKSEA